MFINILSNVKFQNFQINSYVLKKLIFQLSKEEEFDYYFLQQIIVSLVFDYSSQK